MKNLITAGLFIILASSCTGGGGGGGSTSGDSGPTTQTEIVTNYLGTITDAGSYFLVDLVNPNTFQVEKPNVMQIPDDGTTYVFLELILMQDKLLLSRLTLLKFST